MHVLNRSTISYCLTDCICRAADKATVFSKVHADAYDALYSDKDYAGECDMIEALVAEFSAIHPARRLLDLGCGTGGHALLLAARGYSITGVDRSPAMIARARAKAQATGDAGGATFRQGDIRTVRLEDIPYEGAIMMFAVLGYQSCERRARAVLTNVRGHLVPGAALVFDVWYGPGVLADQPSPRQLVAETPAGRLIRRADGRIDEARRICMIQYEVEHWASDTLAESASEQHVMRFFFPEELGQFAADCGFVCLAIRDFPQWRLPAGDRSRRAVVIFRAV